MHIEVVKRGRNMVHRLGYSFSNAVCVLFSIFAFAVAWAANIVSLTRVQAGQLQYCAFTSKFVQGYDVCYDSSSG